MRALVVSLVLIAAVAWLALRAQDGRGAPAPVAAEERAQEKVAESSAAPAPLVAAEAAPAAAEPAPDAQGGAREALQPRTLPISGRVVVPGGIPPDERALVVARLFRDPVPGGRSQRVDAPVARDGAFALEVPEGTGSVALELAGELLVLREPVPVEPGARDVVLRPELLALVRGWVHRSGARLGPSDCEEPPIQVTCAGVETTETDAVGGFRLVVGPGAPLELRAWTDAVAAQRPRTEARLALDALAPGEVREVDLALQPFAAPRGIVVDARGEPVEGAVVSARAGGGGEDPASVALSGADGRFVLEPLAPGEWLVMARADGRFGATETIALPQDGERELRLQLDEAATIRGRVLAPDGSPAPRALVFDSRVRPTFGLRLPDGGAPTSRITFVIDDGAPVAFGTDGSLAGTVRTDDQGRFELEADLPRLRLSAFAPKLALAQEVELELSPGAVVEDVVLRLRPACTLRGTAVDEDGRELVDGLRFRSEDGFEHDVQLDGGTFEIAPLPPGRGTLFRVAEPGGGPHGSLDVELEPGRENVVELRLQGRRR